MSVEHREQIELAINSLQVILDSNAEEKEFQEWFSQHQIAFDVLGFKNPIEHPELICDTQKLIPDFMAQTVTNEWEIIELKTADASILKDTERRHAFFASTESNLSQCAEYSLSFRDTACRKKFNEDYKTNCHKSPSVKLVIGRNNGFDKLLVNDLLSLRTPRISIITYDDVINHLKVRYEALRGIVVDPSGIYIFTSVMAIATESVSDMYIIDICQHGAKSRIQLFTSGAHLVMQTDDASGVTVSIIHNKLPTLYLMNHLEFEVLPLRYETKITLSISGETIFGTTMRNTDFDFSKQLDIVVGSNQQGTAHSSMKIAAILIIQNQIVEPRDKEVLRAWLENPVDEQGNKYIYEYIGHKFMYNEGHQTLGSRMNHSSNLIQEIEIHKPTLRLISTSLESNRNTGARY